MKTNPELQLALDFIHYTNKHIFLTGKAGTGKTTFLRTLQETLPKRMAVVAPTGVAAINARGVTIHSFFQLPFGPILGDFKPDQQKLSKQKINIIKSLDLLVIDEISMVRADVLDGIDTVLRRFKDRSKPFGGLQLLMIGDLQQLSPVAKDHEWELLRPHYETIYFFSSHALRETSFVGIELLEVFRQQDTHFISILNKVRENCLDSETLAALNKRYIPNFQPKDADGYITLCTHNAQAQRINEGKLNLLTTKEKTFKARVNGIFPEYSYPTDFELILKEGAQVMFVKNDPAPEKRFYNGKIGKIVEITKEEIFVQCPDEDEPIAVTPLVWENV
ncbi:MAG: AAA family ATPase, partial [Bacteroidales bacterium]|nr:AAA family ATPase [Bacteroidales bacterium]